MIAQRTTIMTFSAVLWTLNIGIDGRPDVILPATYLQVNYEWARFVVILAVMLNTLSYIPRFFIQREQTRIERVHWEADVVESIKKEKLKNHFPIKKRKTLEETRSFEDAYNLGVEEAVLFRMAKVNQWAETREFAFDFLIPVTIAVGSVVSVFL